jgi:hypothetical protein
MSGLFTGSKKMMKPRGFDVDRQGNYGGDSNWQTAENNYQ